jgi:phenylacetate-CoA ligase
MAKIVGRTDDMLIIRGVNVFPTQIEELILKDGQLSGQYQLVVTRDGTLDKLEVKCELQPSVAATLSGEDSDKVGRRLQHLIKSLIGVTSDVSVLAPDSIPRTVIGKAQRVIDKRPR